MSVPTTLQGTHDGCGGTVVFRPATHRRELLAGAAVTLSAACRACGASLSIEWSMPGAQAAPVERALPLAAGAEEWQYAGPATVQQSQRAPLARPQHGHAASGEADQPVTSLGDWRMRSTPERTSAAEPTERAPRVDNSSIEPHLSAFNSRVEHARESLRRASSDLPSAFDTSDGDSFRTPQLRRTDASLPPSRLSATPSALRTTAVPDVSVPIAAPSFVATEPMPTEAEYTPESPVVEEDATTGAIAAAVASPSFQDDVAAPAAAVVAEPPALPSLAPPSLAAPTPAPPAPLAPITPLVEPASAPALIELAPTDADVFPAAVPTFEPAAPVPPAPADAPASPASVTGPDAVANVWDELPINAPTPAPALAVPAAPVAIPPSPPAAVEDPTTFAEAFGDAAASTPAPTAVVVPEAPQPDVLSPEAGGMPADDASITYESERGFDWGGADAPADKPRRGFSLRRSRTKSEPDTALVVAGPEVVFEPSAEPGARRRVSIGPPELVAIVILAVIAGLAGSKIMSNRNVESLGTGTPAAATIEVAPPAGTSPDPGAVSAANAKGTAAKVAASKAQTTKPKAAPKASAGEEIPALSTTPNPVPGNAVADAGTSDLADAAAGAARSQPASAQVTAAAADTAASAADDSSNPFARP